MWEGQRRRGREKQCLGEGEEDGGWMRVVETMLATSNNSKEDGSGRREGLICFTAFGREGVSKVAGRQPNGGC